MKPNCKQCLPYPICLNILKQNCYIEHSIHKVRYSIHTKELQKKCSIFHNYIIDEKVEWDQIKIFLIDLLELNVAKDQIILGAVIINDRYYPM